MKNSAFTLVETLIAITLMVVGMTAIAGLVLLTTQSNQRNIHQLQATAYAQEGLEVMRFLRDSNTLQNYEWTGVDELDFDLGEREERDLYLQKDLVNCPPCWSFASEEILMNHSGKEFKRRIRLSRIENPADPLDTREDALEVTAIIEWSERGIDRELALSTYLTDWQ